MIRAENFSVRGFRNRSRFARPAGIAAVALLAFAAFGGSDANAQPQQERVTSAFVLAGCRTLVENDPNGNMMQMGACAGAVSTAFDLGKSQRHICPPGDVGLVHAMRTVISFFDEQPSLQSEPFGPVAWRALGARWGCRR